MQFVQKAWHTSGGFMFSKVKINLKGRRLNNIEENKEESQEVLSWERCCLLGLETSFFIGIVRFVHFRMIFEIFG